MKTKKKNILRLLIALVVVIGVVYASLPYYARQALIHWMPVIDDLETFHRHTVHHNPDDVWHWPLSADYNRYQLAEKDAYYLDSLRTVSFLVIRRDSIVFENYRDGWNDTLTSNIYSATKTIVGLLAGVALDEGKIHSLDDPVSRYIPAYTKGMQADVTLRHLLTMSGGMAWDEAYASLFSVTTHGYYGNDLYDLVTSLEVVDRPGVQYSYRSGGPRCSSFRKPPVTSWQLARPPAGIRSLYGRTDASRFIPERSVGKGLTQLLWFPDVGDGLSWYALPLHARYAGTIHHRYS